LAIADEALAATNPATDAANKIRRRVLISGSLELEQLCVRMAISALKQGAMSGMR